MTVKLSPQKVSTILRYYFAGVSQPNIARKVAVDQSTVSLYSSRFQVRVAETGLLKLLLIPDDFSIAGGLTLGFHIYNLNGYLGQSDYNCTQNPSYKPWRIIDGIVDDLPGYKNYSQLISSSAQWSINSKVSRAKSLLTEYELLGQFMPNLHSECAFC